MTSSRHDPPPHDPPFPPLPQAGLLPAQVGPESAALQGDPGEPHPLPFLCCQLQGDSCCSRPGPHPGCDTHRWGLSGWLMVTRAVPESPSQESGPRCPPTTTGLGRKGCWVFGRGLGCRVSSTVSRMGACHPSRLGLDPTSGRAPRVQTWTPGLELGDEPIPHPLPAAGLGQGRGSLLSPYWTLLGQRGRGGPGPSAPPPPRQREGLQGSDRHTALAPGRERFIKIQPRR